MDNWLILVGIGFLILILIFPFLPIGTRPRCPECGSRKVGVQKNATGIRTSDFGGGGEGGGGGYSAVQTHYEVKYRCNVCQTQWRTITTETG